MTDAPNSKVRVAPKRCNPRGLIRILVGGLLMAQLALASEDPEALQKHAVQVVSDYKLNFYRTGDLKSILPALQKAHEDLNISYQAFLARDDTAAAALSLLTMADIERMTTVQDFTHIAENQDSPAHKYLLRCFIFAPESS
jgi:hypothetical protein